MRILIELPTWLGDTVMTTPALVNLISNFKSPEINIVGSFVSTEVIKNYPMVVKSVVLKKDYLALFRTAKNLGQFDLYFSFRNSFRSKVFKFFVTSKKKYQYDKRKYQNCHQVEKYNYFVNDCLDVNLTAGKLKIYTNQSPPSIKKILTVGINPGASFGEAKRWYPEKFAEVAAELSNKYNIIIFGGINEEHIANDIERILVEKGISNFSNLAGKTSISDLVDYIACLDLLITGDSGPMHLAASFQVPTISIFGPTRDIETSQWMNTYSVNVKKNLACQPCMRRTCPLIHHNCMKLITVDDVLKGVRSFIKLN